MKILMITSIYPTKQHPDYGTFVKNIHDLYLEAGHQVTLVAFQRRCGKIEKLRETLRFFSRIRRELSHQSDYDLINLQYPYLAALPVSRYLSRIRIPLWVSLHGSDVFHDSLSKRLLGKPTERILRGCTRIIVPSEFFARKVSQVFQLSADRFRVIPSGGYDGRIFYPQESDPARDPARGSNPRGAQGSELQLPGLRRIGFASRLVEGKGWRVLLKAFAAIAAEKELENCRLILAGSGVDAEGIRNLASELGLGDRVDLIGAQKPAQLADFYRTLDLFVFPTLFEESLGMVGIEAMACGIPVVASASGGVSGYIRDGVDGFLVPPGDMNALAQAILNIARYDAEQYQELTASAVRGAAGYERNAVRAQLETILTEELG